MVFYSIKKAGYVPASFLLNIPYYIIIYISPKTLEIEREFCYNYIVRSIINKCCLRCCK